MWDCEYAATPFYGVDMPPRPLTWSITPRHDMLKCHKPAVNSRRLERKYRGGGCGFPSYGNKVCMLCCALWRTSRDLVYRKMTLRRCGLHSLDFSTASITTITVPWTAVSSSCQNCDGRNAQSLLKCYISYRSDVPPFSAVKVLSDVIFNFWLIWLCFIGVFVGLPALLIFLRTGPASWSNKGTYQVLACGGFSGILAQDGSLDRPRRPSYPLIIYSSCLCGSSVDFSFANTFFRVGVGKLMVDPLPRVGIEKSRLC